MTRGTPPSWSIAAASALTVACFLATAFLAASWYRRFVAIGDLPKPPPTADEMQGALHRVFLFFFLTAVCATGFVALFAQCRSRSQEPTSPLPWR